MPQYALAFLGAAEAGFVITTRNPTYTSGDIKGHLMNDAAEGTNIQIILIGDQHDPNCISFESMLKDPGDLIDSYVTSPDSVEVLPYSSGTTGVPKRVQLTHWNLVAQMEQLADPEVKLVDMEQVTVCVLPLYHIFAMHVTMSNMLWNAGKLVAVSMFEPSMFLKTLVDYRPTTIHIAPPLVGFLANHPAVTPGHLASLNTIVVGAAPAGQALIDLFNKRAPNVRFREEYGMTEMSPAVTFTRLQVEQTGGSCGQLLSNTNMKVLDMLTEEEKGPGETGELCFQGPQVMPGYLKIECNKRSAFFGAINSLVETVTGEVNI